MTRLGSGFAQRGRLAPGPFDRSLNAIGKMKAIADGFEITELRAVATSAVREATNGPEFKREAWKRHRVRIEVISAEEEARLAFLSATRRFNLDGRAAAIADIGGGSLEVVLSAGEVIDQMESLDLGAVRLTEAYVHSDPLRKKHWKLLRSSIDTALEQHIGDPPFRVELMVGSGGTFSALGGMVRYEREGREGNPHGYFITRAEVTKLLARLQEVPLEGRKQLPGLPPQRADIILAGAAVVARLARYLDCRQIVINDGGVRDGLLLSMIGDLMAGTSVTPTMTKGRLDRVRRFARKCRVNERHCEHVAMLAGQVFDGLHRRHRLSAQAREILVAAALLHEIGFLVNHAGHHKHAYHLIMHSDLAGFTAREVELIANVARYHRRAYPKRKHANFARLSKTDRKLVRTLAGILRIAVAFDRSHTQIVQGVRVYSRKSRVRLTLLASKEPQVELWDASRKTGLFEKAFDVVLDVGWEQVRAERALRVVRGRQRAAGRR